MNRQIKNLCKRQLFFFHKLATKVGIHILPAHYYSSIPNLYELEKNKHFWAQESKLPGLETDLDEQIKNLKNICLPYQSEYKGNKAYRHAVANRFGPGYGYIEAQALHAVMRYFKPRKVIEVGSGVSTWCILKALEMNREEIGEEFAISCIEPYPSLKLKQLKEIELIKQPVQRVHFEDAFHTLKKNDLLFIDSSHAVKPGSDVNHLILEILPRLKPGVIVHFHDIYFPFDYSPDVLQTFFHWMETSLLRAFLTHNNKAKILFCQSHLHHCSQQALREVFPEYNPKIHHNGIQDKKYKPFEYPQKEHFPASIYIQIL